MMRRGFTFIELLVVMAIVSVLALTSSVVYSRFLLQNSAGVIEDELAGELRKAQLYAMMSKQGSSWGVNIASSTLTLYKGASFATRTTTFDETFSLNPNITISGMTDVNFARVTGLPSTTPTVTITGNGITRTLTVNAQGTVTK